MTRKATIVLKFLVGLVIGILFYSIAFQIYASVYRISSSAEKSFNDLYSIILKLGDGDLDSMKLELDERSGILVFQPSGGDISIKSDASSLTGQQTHYIFEKPSSCRSNFNQCFCLCKTLNKRGVLPPITYSCPDPICHDIPKSPVVELLPKDYGWSYYGDGGTVLIRGYVAFGKWLEDANLDTAKLASIIEFESPLSTPRRYEVSIKREGNIIKICDTYPCSGYEHKQ